MESEYPRAFSSQVFALIDAKVTQYLDVRLRCGTTETGYRVAFWGVIGESHRSRLYPIIYEICKGHMTLASCMYVQISH